MGISRPEVCDGRTTTAADGRGAAPRTGRDRHRPRAVPQGADARELPGPETAVDAGAQEAEADDRRADAAGRDQPAGAVDAGVAEEARHVEGARGPQAGKGRLMLADFSNCC